jgi:RNA polymerase sigma factor (sigma-70 family)
MSEENVFADFIRRVRSGDQQAAEEFVRKYEHVIRLEVRMRLSDPRMFRLFDSMDICQSVLASFFLRCAAGQYDLDDPGRLVGLLVAMTRRKLAFQSRKQLAQRRDARRVVGVSADDMDVAAVEPTADEKFADVELLEEFRRRLAPEERQLAELRGADRGWSEIAQEMGGTPEGRRKQLERAIDRVSRELGLEGGEE